MQEWLDALAGLAEGARVIIRQPDGERLAAILTGCLDAGLVAVPLHPGTTDRDTADMAERVSASLIIAAGGAPTEVVHQAGRPDHPEACGLALIMFTSGSTGRPKGVKLSRRAVLGNARRTAALHGISPQRPHGTCLPLYHCNALVMSLYGTHITGSPLILHEWSDPKSYFAELDAKGARTASIVPARLAELVEVAPAWPELLDYLITAAAPLPKELAARFYRLYGPRLRQGYGLTEAVNFSTLMPTLDAAEFAEQYVERIGPVGLPVGSTELRIEGGEVWIRSPDMMDGYWEDTATTAAVLGADGWLRTGDLGEWRGDYLVLRGRRTELINRGGEKFYPVDLESRWRNAGLTGAFAAVPVPEPTVGAEMGLVLESQEIAGTRSLVCGRGPRPAVVQAGGIAVTSTGKPRRTAMGRGLAVKRDSAQRYEELLGYARSAALAILDGGHEPACARGARIREQVQALVRAHPGGTGTAAVYRRTAAHECLDLLVESWPSVAEGTVAGEPLMRGHRGLWKRLMTEWPMVGYAEAIADVLVAGDHLHGRVLEVGAGVGNTTTLVADRVEGEFVWSDRVAELVGRGRWPGRGVVYDLDGEPPAGLGTFDAILATNVLHCVADKEYTLRVLHSLLNDGGRLVLAEGASPTTADGTPWALDHLFSLWDGWWDRGGFVNRWDWLAMFGSAGLTHRGFSVLRAGRHDLGGVVWGRR